MALPKDFGDIRGSSEENGNRLAKIGANRDHRLNLKGILKSTFENPSSGYIDFNNECKISGELNTRTQHQNLRREISGSETLSSRKMARDEENDLSEERLSPHPKDEDDSYFIASTSSPTSTSTTQWTTNRSREREGPSTAAVAASILKRDYYYGEDPPLPPISISPRNNGGKCQTNYSGRPESPSLTRRLIFRLFQLTSVLLIIMGIVTLVTPSMMTLPPPPPGIGEILLPDTSEPSRDSSLLPEPHLDIRDALREWALKSEPIPPDDVLPSLDLSLLNIPQFHYTLNNHQLCQSAGGGNSNASNGIYFVILVHSAPTHFVERQAIRTSWGSVKSFRNWSIRLVFLLGQTSRRGGEGSEDSGSLQEGILNESDLYGDIVRGDFEDSYRNLTYKHLMGYKWVLGHCPSAKFIIKTDDDAFLDIFQLFDFAQRNYGLNPGDILLCNIYPEGTQPVRNSSSGNPEGYKWIVTREEYPFQIYPKYCGGLGYLATVDVVRRLSSIGTLLKRWLWIDDVFVTGVMRELVGKEPFYLNLRYSYDEVEYRNWLNDRSPRHRLRKIPYMFVHVTRGARFTEDMAQLWRKTVRAWS